VEQFLGIGSTASTELSVSAKVLMDDGDLLSFGVEVCYNLALGAGRLVRLCGGSPLSDQLLREDP